MFSLSNARLCLGLRSIRLAPLQLSFSAHANAALGIQAASTRVQIPENIRYYNVSLPRFQETSGDEEEDLGLNPGLGSVMSQGAGTLERTAADVQAKTKKVKTLVSSQEKSSKKDRPQQLAERQRILDVANDCLEAICDRNPNNPLAVGGEPLVLVDVQVNSTAKQAKVFWTLPYSILLDERLTPTAYKRLMSQVEANFDGSLLQRQVHTRLSFYYPPRLKFYPAPPQMIAEMMAEIVE